MEEVIVERVVVREKIEDLSSGARVEGSIGV